MIWISAVALLVTIVLGLYCLASRGDDRRYSFAGSGIAGVVCLLLLVLSFIRVIGPGHVGVQMLFGGVQNATLQEGLHFVNPFIDVEELSVRTEAYTMSGMRDEGDVVGDDAITVLSKDGLPISMDITIWYRLESSDAPRVYQTIGPDYVTKIIRPAVRTAIREESRQFNAIETFGTQREALATAISKRLDIAFEGRGIVLERTLLRNIVLPAKVSDSIEAKLTAEQDAQRMVFVLQREELEADRKVVEARGIKESQTIIAASLTKEYLQWYFMQTMQQLVDSPNNSTIILPFDSNLVPLLPIGGSQ